MQARGKIFQIFQSSTPARKTSLQIRATKQVEEHDVFHVFLLEQDTTKKERVETAIELDKGDSEEYEVEAICDSKVYAKKSNSGELPSLYYLVSWKGYSKEKNTWELTSAVLHLHKLISTFHHDHPEKSTANSLPINSAQPIERLIIKPKAEASSTKRKQSKTAKANGTNKRAKKNWTSSFLSRFWPYLNSRQKNPLSHVIFSSAPLCSA